MSADRWQAEAPGRDPAPCAGCGTLADCDGKGLCPPCAARMAEFGDHEARCACDGCQWYRETEAVLDGDGDRECECPDCGRTMARPLPGTAVVRQCGACAGTVRS